MIEKKLLDVFLDEFNDLAGRGARSEDCGDASSFQAGDISFGDNAAADNQNVVHAFFLQEFNNFREQGVVSAGEQAQGYNVNVVLQGSFSDLFGSQADTGVDNFETSVAQSAGNYLSATVMAVQTRFCN